jgi:hypothetical protein
MKRVKLYSPDGDMIICWEDSAARLIKAGWSVDEPSKVKAKTKKSAIVATKTDENEV